MLHHNAGQRVVCFAESASMLCNVPTWEWDLSSSIGFQVVVSRELKSEKIVLCVYCAWAGRVNLEY